MRPARRAFATTGDGTPRESGSSDRLAAPGGTSPRASCAGSPPRIRARRAGRSRAAGRSLGRKGGTPGTVVYADQAARDAHAANEHVKAFLAVHPALLR